jgi:membrane-bound metal-dependent hydrolase YbcI (DUF457 family)
MAPTHALSGAALWLAGSWAASHYLDLHQTPAQLAVATIVCAGAALLPDLDCAGKVTTNTGGATVARTFGVVSLFLAECVEKFAWLVYRLTSTKKDGRRNGGHRTLTHTWIFNLALGLGVTALCARWGRPATLGILFFTTGLAIRGLMANAVRKHGWIITTAAAAGVSYIAAQALGPQGHPLLGIAVAAGGVIHTFGDMITKAGCPVLWPIPTGRRLWREFGVPDAIAVKVGGKVEVLLLRPLLTIASVLLFLGVLTHATV